MYGIEMTTFLVIAGFALFAMAYAGVKGGAAMAAGLMRGIPGAEMVDIMVGGQRLRCRVVRDRWWYDTISVEAANTYRFFETTALKTRAYQHFEGDRSLVKEREYALIYAAVSYLMVPEHNGLLDTPDIVALYDNSSFRWEQDKVVVDEDRMKVLAGGVSARVSGAAAIGGEAQPGDGRHDNMRIYTKPKLITGGRSVDFSVQTGTALSVAKDLQIALYGLWLLPVGKVAAPPAGV